MPAPLSAPRLLDSRSQPYWMIAASVLVLVLVPLVAGVGALRAMAIGAGATLCLDAWNLFLARAFALRSLDYCLLGRLTVRLSRGALGSPAIAAAEAQRGECGLGWVAHYGIGASLALAFDQWVVPGWAGAPTLVPALLYGVATVVLPFFVLQPALGLGVASSATRRPAQARLKSLATHAVYGIGLYGSARVAAWVMAA